MSPLECHDYIPHGSLKLIVELVPEQFGEKPFGGCCVTMIHIPTNRSSNEAVGRTDMQIDTLYS